MEQRRFPVPLYGNPVPLNPLSADCLAWLTKMLLAEQHDMDAQLKLAVSAKDTKTAVDLILRGAKTSFLVDGLPLLHHLVMKQMDAVLKCCMDNGAELKAVNLKLAPLLHFAVELSCINAIEILLERMDINMLDFEDSTPLFYAVRAKNFVVLSLLLRRRAAVNIQNRFGNTPLHEAVYHSPCPWLLKELLLHGADVNVRNKDGDTALDVALQRPNGRSSSASTPIIKELLAWGSVVDAKSAGAVNILVSEPHCDFVTLKRVVEKKNCVNGQGSRTMRTPLHYAVYNNRIDLARLLLENGAKIDAIDCDGVSPLRYGLANDCSPRMIMFMIDMGASVSTHTAMYMHHKAIARTVKAFLLKNRKYMFTFMQAFISKTNCVIVYNCIIDLIKYMTATEFLNFYLAFH